MKLRYEFPPIKTRPIHSIRRFARNKQDLDRETGWVAALQCFQLAQTSIFRVCLAMSSDNLEGKWIPETTPQVVIENPVLSSLFEEPKCHFKFTEDDITNRIVEERRISQYFVPIPGAKKKRPKQLSIETQWSADSVEENKDINRIRKSMENWNALYSTSSYFFEKSKSGKIAVKVINHYGDEVLKVYDT